MYKKMYLKEFELYDGECFVTFNMGFTKQYEICLKIISANTLTIAANKT